MKQLMKRFATMALAIIVAASFVPTGGVAFAAADAESGGNPSSELTASAQTASEGGLAMGTQDSVAGAIWMDYNTTYYTTAEKLVNKVKTLKGKTFTIQVSQDWKGVQLRIPQNAKVTLEMNGCMIDRNLSKNTSSGSVIYLEAGSSLVINGGNTSTSHEVPVYGSLTNSSKKSDRKTIKGAVITGGWSSNGGGGIHVLGKCNLVLNNVTIAGCQAEQSWGSDGYGGGIYVGGGDNSVSLNSSTITGCYAYNDGGGIYEANKDLFGLYMKKSHIDGNFAGRNGGGIAVSGENLTISGDGKTTVSNNRAGGTYGGGVYIWNDDVSVSGLIIEGNEIGKSSNSGLGGGLYCMETGISLSNLVARNNKADKGGGMFINKYKVSISGCTVTGNTAQTAGGGIMANSGIKTKFDLAGKCIIKDNLAKGAVSNLFLSSGNRANLNLAKDSDVHILYEGLKADYQMITEGKVNDHIKNSNCIRFLTSDNKGYHFTFNSDANQRKIYMVKDGLTPAGTGSAYTSNAKKVTVSAENAGAQNTSRTIKGDDGNVYRVIRGYFTHPDVDNSDQDTSAAFYYSDGFFANDPKKYNEHLATASISMAMAGFYLNAGGRTDYSNKHAAARQFLVDIGCAEENVYVNDLNTIKPGTDTIGVTIGNKKLMNQRNKETGYILVPVTVRGAGYEAEWASNVSLGTEGMGGPYPEAQGFANAADQVFAEIQGYLKNYGLEDELAAGKVKFWVVGYSRAGATANLTSKRLIEAYDQYGAQVFGYCCEAPQGGTDWAEALTDKTKYYCIHNMINKADLVPLVAPEEEMYFKRYGVDHYIPGTPAGAVKSLQRKIQFGAHKGKSRTMYSDNEPTYTKTTAYEQQRDNKMLSQLAMVDSGMVFDDYFHVASMDYKNTAFIETGDYSVTAEKFIEDFIITFTKKIPGLSRRIGYAETYQEIFRDLVAMVFGMPDDVAADFIARASSVMQRFSLITPLSSTVSKFEIYRKVIQGWNNLNENEKTFYRDAVWSRLEETGALDFLTASQRQTLKRHWPLLADFLFKYVAWDFNTVGGEGWYPSDLPTSTKVEVLNYNSDLGALAIGTFGYNGSRLMSAHYPEINLAWARSYDSFYDNEDSEYVIASPASVSSPTAKINGEALAGSGTFEFSGNKRMELDVPGVTGETIYYTLENKTDKKNSGANKVYKGALNLTNPAGRSATEYKVTAYAMWHGGKSASVSWNIKIGMNAHNLTVNTQVNKYNDASEIIGEDSKTEKVSLKDGETVTLVAMTPRDKVFLEWLAIDGEGNDVSDKIFTGEYANQRHLATARFVLPYGPSVGLAEDYTLTFNAVYADKAKNLVVKLTQPVTGAQLQGTATVSWGDEEEQSISVPVSWRYLQGAMYIAQGNETVEGGSSYTATLRFAENEAAQFASEITAALAEESGSANSIKTVRANGTITITIEFPVTANEQVAVVPRTLTLKVYDEAAGQFMDEYQSEIKCRPGSEVLVQAPDVEGYAFDGWLKQGTWVDPDAVAYDSYGNAVGLKFSMTEFDQTFELKYRPIVNRVDITIPEPVADDYLASEADIELKYTIANEYTVDPAYLGLDWQPAPIGDWWIADFETAYTADIWLQPDEDGNIGIIDAAGNKALVGIDTFVYADDLRVTVNGKDASFDQNEDEAWFTFPATDEYVTQLLSVTQPSDIVDVPYGATSADVRALLPKTAAVTVEDDSVGELPVSWTSLSCALTPGDDAGLEEAVWTATGALTQPFPKGVVNDNGVDLTVTQTVKVLSAPYTPEPQCTVPSSVRTSAFDAMLYVDSEDATIYYTTDGSDPAVSGAVFDGTPIRITRNDVDADGMVVIRTFATAPKHKPSGEASYMYIFTDKIPVPKGEELSYDGTEQLGVYGDEMYTLEAAEGSGITIDDEGNAVVTNAGTYRVTAKLVDPANYSWVLEAEGEDGEDIETDDDQVIEFTVAKGSLADAEVAVDPIAEYTGSAIEPKVYVTTGGEDVPASDYAVKFAENTKVGIAKVTVEAAGGNCEGNPAPVTFTIIPKQAAIAKVGVALEELTVTMASKVDATGGTSYQVGYKKATDSDWQTVDTAETAAVLGNLQGGTSYKIRARACAKVGDETVYGAWSDEVAAIPTKVEKGADGTDFGKGASLETAENAINNMKNDKDPAGTVYRTLRLQSKKQTKNSITFIWKKVKNATKYVVFAGKCGKGNKMTKVKTLKGRKLVLKKLGGKALAKGKYYKCMVIAVDKDNKVLSASKVTHVATKGGKYGNYKTVKTAAKKNTVNLTVGKTFKLKGKGVPASSKLKVSKHRAIAYESSNKKIATVTSKGVIKGVKAGSCVIYAYAQSGTVKAIKVKVKAKAKSVTTQAAPTADITLRV